jgi:hypothetical protein
MFDEPRSPPTTRKQMEMDEGFWLQRMTNFPLNEPFERLQDHVHL